MSDREAQREERAIYVVGASVMLPIVIATIARHHDFGAGSTISLLLVVLGVLGFLGSARRRRARLPMMRVHQDRADGLIEN
jgi:hypothetical protein